MPTPEVRLGGARSGVVELVDRRRGGHPRGELARRLGVLVVTALFLAGIAGLMTARGGTDQRRPPAHPRDVRPLTPPPGVAHRALGGTGAIAWERPARPHAPASSRRESKARPAPPVSPVAVVALIDTGINPYSVAFRDRSDRAYRHPSTYIPGYPRDASPVPISLDVPYELALEKDRRLWASVQPNRLYWFPGTRIVGAISLAPGGTYCPHVAAPPLDVAGGDCREHPILDDHGHGTMTASRAAGAPHSLGPEAHIVAVEGLGPAGVRWATDAGWIDVQSHSWADLLPHPLTDVGHDVGVVDASAADAMAYAAARTLTVVAAGNGLGGFVGVAPNPTLLSSTTPPGVVVVGAHDNGRVAPWSSAPPHVVADGYGGYTAGRDTAAMRPDPAACCTSAAAPYVAGAAATLVAHARRLLGDTRTGARGGTVAAGRAGVVAAGPLADGRLTLDELRQVLLRTAEARPSEGRDDGLVHWAGEARAPEPLPHGPGANPYCPGCATAPVEWEELAPGAPAFPLVGYGAVNERSVTLSLGALAGRTPVPDRADDDRWYEEDQQRRRALFP